MEAMKEAENRKKIVAAVPADEEDKEPRRQKMAEVDVYGKNVMTFFDTDAIPEVMYAAHCESLRLKPRKIGRRITMVDTKEALVVREVVGVPFTVGPITTERACLVVH